MHADEARYERYVTLLENRSDISSLPKFSLECVSCEHYVS